MYLTEGGSYIVKRWGSPDRIWLKGFPERTSPEVRRKCLDELLQKYAVPQPPGYPHKSAPEGSFSISAQFDGSAAASKFKRMLDGAKADRDPLMNCGGKKRAEMRS